MHFLPKKISLFYDGYTVPKKTLGIVNCLAPLSTF